MLEDILVRHCAPTLAGIKTGSLCSCPYNSQEHILKEVRSLNQVLTPKGLAVLPLQYMEKRVLIYLFRPEHLKQDLSDTSASRLLQNAGYHGNQLSDYLMNLIHRLYHAQSFPHEIGLFLSYPPEDVRGFIENHARNFKCVGCWKVYGDEQAARKRFAQYKKCTAIYCKQRNQGKSVYDLAVAM